MASFRYRVEQYVGPAEHSLDSLLTQAARSLVDIIPENRADRYTTVKEDEGNGIDLDGVRFIAAYKEGRQAVLKATGMEAALQDRESIHYATEFTPAAIMKAGGLFIYPNGGSAHVIPYPTVKQDEETIENFPEAFDSLVVVSTAQQRVIEKMNARSVDDDDVELSGPIANLRDRLNSERQNLLQTLFPQAQQQPQQQTEQQ